MGWCGVVVVWCGGGVWVCVCVWVGGWKRRKGEREGMGRDGKRWDGMGRENGGGGGRGREGEREEGRAREGRERWTFLSFPTLARCNQVSTTTVPAAIMTLKVVSTCMVSSGNLFKVQRPLPNLTSRLFISLQNRSLGLRRGAE